MAADSGTWPYPLPSSGNDAVAMATRPLAGSLFREYDIRGRVRFAPPTPELPIDEFSVKRIGRAFGTSLRATGFTHVVVGFDGRSYSEPLANAVILGLLSTGIDVTNIGLATTPMVYFAQHHLGGTAGVAVTASHNPNGWAGLKLAHAPSLTLGPEGIRELADIAASGRVARGSGRLTERSVTDAYVAELAKRLPAPGPATVVVDGGNSVAGPIAEMALSQAGYTVFPINRELDWTFPNHEPDPESVAARAQIQRAVLQRRADCGLSFDGDGDRLGVTDERGGIVWADTLLAVLARDALTRHPGAPIVFDVKCSRAVPETILAAGGVPVMWKTGHSHIKNKLREIGSPFGGERSGHFFDSGDYYGFDDAVYAALRLMRVATEAGLSMCELRDSLPRYSIGPTMHAHCPDERKYDVVEEFAARVATLGAREVVRINGARVEFDDGWVLVRASSNIPALVVVAEADTDERLHDMYRIAKDVLDSIADVDPSWENDPWNGEVAGGHAG
jgi:phosphomannomutase